MIPAPNADQRYLDFYRETLPVFERHPQVEPLRYFVFRQLYLQQRGMGPFKEGLVGLRAACRSARSIGSRERADVLLWFSGRREAVTATLLPVYRELRSRGVRARPVAFRGPIDLPKETLRFRCVARARPPRWTKPVWEELADLLSELRRQDLRRAFYRACAGVQGLLDELNRVLDALRPRLVLVMSTQVSGGAGVVVAANSQRIPTLVLQHGILQPFYLPVLADRMATWGPSSQKTLLDLGVPPERLVMLGSPRHDVMKPGPDDMAARLLRSKLGLSERPTFVFCSNGNDPVRNGNAPRHCAEWLEEGARRLRKQVNVVVRLHPLEDGSLYRGLRELRVTKGEISLSTTLDGSDSVGSLCSTVLYEGLLFHKPVWHFHADGWPELARNWQEGLATRVASATDLERLLNSMDSSGIRQNGSNRLVSRVFVNHGRATAAVADYIEAEAAGVA